MKIKQFKFEVHDNANESWTGRIIHEDDQFGVILDYMKTVMEYNIGEVSKENTEYSLTGVANEDGEFFFDVEVYTYQSE